jgi:hypothetical protein
MNTVNKVSIGAVLLVTVATLIGATYPHDSSMPVPVNTTATATTTQIDTVPTQAKATKWWQWLPSNVCEDNGSPASYFEKEAKTHEPKIEERGNAVVVTVAGKTYWYKFFRTLKECQAEISAVHDAEERAEARLDKYR